MAILEPNGHLALIHTCGKGAKLFTACFLGSDVQNYFPLNEILMNLISPFFGYLVLGCSYQNLRWSSGVLFFSSLFKLYRTPTCKTWYIQEDFNGLWCERLLNIFFGLRFFCLFFLGAKVILYSVLVYQKHWYLKTSFVEKLSRKSFAACEALLYDTFETGFQSLCSLRSLLCWYLQVWLFWTSWTNTILFLYLYNFVCRFKSNLLEAETDC